MDVIILLLVVGAVLLVAGVVLFGLARRAMKLMVRVAIFGVIVIALLVGGVTWWFTGSGKGKSNRPSNSRRK